ncbi:sensor histidine kinase [Micromonospora rubida]|uniref:sensor histidine kinase n=1 Tax=Micromonospora rubida TaxID=2697657 RepID=UPI001377396D|nr:histidine kinase [Micromonospora rubida]NBE83592.1 sensor histidine kinase [Micromonospora rubida]
MRGNATTSDGGPGGPAGRWSALRGSLVLTAQLVTVMLMTVVTVIASWLIPLGVGVLIFPGCVRVLHRQAERLSRADRRFAGTGFAVPSLPDPAGSGFAAGARQCWRLLTDRAFWQLMRWAVLDPYTGVLLAITPFGYVAWGLYGCAAIPVLHLGLGLRPTEWYAFVPVTSTSAVPYAVVLGCGLVVFGALSGPWWLRTQARWSSVLIGSHLVDLQARVSALSATREEVRDDAAARLRRIERDVHDGAQAQLVAITMKLGVAETLVPSDPNAALALIGQARADSLNALGELRDLMRGIHPPVLADRGLGAAIEAMAIEAALPTTTRVRLPARLDSSLESAAYFATREVLTNAAKHSGAAHLAVTADIVDGRLRIGVRDDGKGGAVIVPGGGLDGIRRRLAAFDGALTVSSPADGPTEIVLEVPCASSSQRTR